tara:strand:- start:489 stop:1553 length:1065 start_codon:yes stop_codon:yes gene_type:complete
MDSKKQSQTSISSEDFQGILESIGYSLIDCGDHWRTQAIYRDGNNKTAVKIYKNTGVWMDFVQNKGCMPFEALIRLTLKDDREVAKIIGNSAVVTETTYEPKQKIEMEKIYPDSTLDRLFPNYNFYKQRNISDHTQELFQAGLAGVGKMYRRMVFPVYNEHQQIVGFSGRKVDDDNDYPKWKHIGKRNNWVYPAFNEKTFVDQEITKKQEVVLVESIGDAMALYDQGIKNVLVIFGLSVNNNIVNYLNSKSIRHIYISTNNDKASEQNRGFIAALKSFLKLSKYFDLDMLTVKFPPKGYNDFGDAHLDNYNLNSWLDKDIDKDAQIKYILEFVKNNPSSFTKKDIKTALFISDA